jgi:hypothetical protein
MYHLENDTSNSYFCCVFVFVAAGTCLPVVEQQWDDTNADKKQGDFVGLLFF